MKPQITVFELGPRDGLQNEPKILNLKTKTWFINSLVKTGILNIEIGAFVRPDLVPQMKNTEMLYKKIQDKSIRLRNTKAWSLVPNLRGVERAFSCGAKNLAVFTAVTDSFNQANVGMSFKKQLKEFKRIIEITRLKKLQLRAYLSTAFGCPFEGKVNPIKALKAVEKLLNLGFWQISIGDTIGVATPKDVENIVKPAIKNFGTEKIALHFHDTRGTALANALKSIELGVTTLDSSAGGLGGCPFAPGASGNLATEDLVYMLHGMGLKTGIDLDRLSKISIELSKKMGRIISSRYVMAFFRSKNTRKK